MGKTRLVQEFYRNLLLDHDPHGYWPDASLFAGDNLRCAPDLEDAHTHQHYASFALDDRPIPFLWWGFRLADPVARNATSGGLAAHRRTLDLHLVPALFGRSRSQLMTSVSESAREHAAQLGKKAVLDLVKALPAVGSIATLLEWGLELSERASQTAAGARKAYLDDRKIHESTLSRLGDDRTTRLLERTLEDLARILAPDNGLSRLPVVVFCDDAQFAGSGGDEGALRLLEGLWERAHLGGWPLMLVLSHWEVEWNQRASAGPEREPTSGSVYVASSFAAAARSAQFGTVLDLSNRTDLVDLLRSGLPGLEQDDERLLLGKADGNPQLLVELIELVRRAPAWRLDGPAGLTPHAKRQIEGRFSKLAELIRDRLESDSTPDIVRQVVALSSLQGMRFACALTRAAAKELQLPNIDEGLQLSQHPHRLVAGVESGAADFLQRAHREASESLVGSYLGDPQSVRRSLLEAAIELEDGNDRPTGMTPIEKATAAGVLVALGEHDNDPAIRLYAARALLRQVRQALEEPRGADVASAAEAAVRFQAGVGSRWSLEALDLADVVVATAAIADWHGDLTAAPLAWAQLERARSLAANQRTPEVLRLLGLSLRQIMKALVGMTDWPAARATLEERLAILSEVAEQVDTCASHLDLLGAYGEMVALAAAQQDLATASRFFEPSIELLARLARRDDLEDHSCLASHLALGSGVAAIAGQWDNAERLAQTALDLAPEEQALAANRKELGNARASALTVLAGVAMGQGNADAAAQRHEAVIGFHRARCHASDLPEHWLSLAIALGQAGNCSVSNGDPGTAIDYLGERRKIMQALMGRAGSPVIVRGFVLANLELAELAVELEVWGFVLDEGPRMLEFTRLTVDGIDHLPVLARMLKAVSVAAMATGRTSEAADLCRERVRVARRLGTHLKSLEARQNLADAMAALSVVCLESGDVARACKHARRAERIWGVLRARFSSEECAAAEREATAFIARHCGDLRGDSGLPSAHSSTA